MLPALPTPGSERVQNVLVYLYLGALIFGGVLIGSSILLGGHDDGDFDADADADLDLDADADADVDADHGDIDKDIPLDGGDFFLWPLKSLRFWTFFLAAFGLVGLLLQGFGLADEIPTLIAALGVGGLSGFTAAWAIKKLAYDETGRAAASSDYIGKSAKVLVPVRPKSVGKIRVRVRGQSVDLLATTDEDDLTAEDEVIVIQMDGTRARIARLDRERET
jgi:membrane protein implicated in regulation of membrane protease activity